MKQKLVSPPGGVVGQVSNFTAIGAPTGGSPTQPVTWKSDNPNDAVSVDTTDPSGLTVNVVFAGPAGTSTLTVTDASGATGSLAVPVSAGPPPPPTAFTSYTIVQNS